MTRSRAILFAAVLLIVSIGVLVLLVRGGHVEKAPPVSLTVPVDGLDSGAKDDTAITVPRAAVEQAAPRLEDDLHTPPPATPSGDLEAVKRAEQENRQSTDALPVAGATAGFKGCRTSFVNNQSSRRGVRPVWQVLHYTVSPNRKGWSDVDAVVALFNRSSSQASSHFVIDSEGHCAYIVPVEQKSWTEAAANSFSVAYEIIATGREQRYLEPAGMARLRSVVHEVSRRIGSPLQRGSANGCTPSRAGLMQHADFGICGGGHVDVKPFNANAIIVSLTAGAMPVTATDRATCRKLNYWRSHGRRQAGLKNAVRRRDALARRHVTCTARGPVRT